MNDDLFTCLQMIQLIRIVLYLTIFFFFFFLFIIIIINEPHFSSWIQMGLFITLSQELLHKEIMYLNLPHLPDALIQSDLKKVSRNKKISSC